MVVWSDNLDDIVQLCRDFQNKVMKLVWKQRGAIESVSLTGSPSTSVSPSTTASEVNLIHKAKQATALAKETGDAAAAALAASANEKSASSPPVKKGWRWNPFKRSSPAEQDVERGNTPAARPTRLLAAVQSGLAAALAICTLLDLIYCCG